MRGLALAVVCVAVACVLPDAVWAEGAGGVGLSRRAICYVYSNLGGTIGLLIGFSAALYGLWIMIKGSFGGGLFFIMGGAAVTVMPDMVAAFLGGTQNVLGQAQISERGDGGRDVASDYSFIKSKKSDCDAGIPVDLSYLEPPPVPGVQVVRNADGTYSVLSPDGTGIVASGIGSLQDAQDVVNAFGSGYVGVNSECASLTKFFTPGVGAASTWQPGMKLTDGDPAIGTAIATFQNFNDGRGLSYGPSYSPGGASGQSHTGIYLGRTADGSGFKILEQYNGSGGPKVTVIPYNNPGKNASNGNNYYVIKGQ